MKAYLTFSRRVSSQGILLVTAVASLGAAIALAVPRQQRAPLDAPPLKADGKELFTREWIANDPRSHRGDGLGPVFNDTSCVACHNQGGPGGGGPANKNVQILTATPVLTRLGGFGSGAVSQSFVLHHFGTDADFAAWRLKMAQSVALGMGPFSGPMPSIPSGVVPGSLPPSTPSGVPNPGSGGASFLMVGGNQISQRNATALFAAGKIDAIPQRVLEAAAARTHAQFPAVTGRVARDNKGQAGRFGWKAQKSRLEDFVLTACAVELGLHVPGHDQPPVPHKPDYKAPGFDLTKAECDALVKFVRSLPVPTQQRPDHPKAAEYIDSGKALFASVGCATCHTPKLGDADGIYSDLLLHDMGPGLTDAALSGYGVFQPNPQQPTPKPGPKPDEIVKARGKVLPEVVAEAQEWRTPPLWGVRDSGPYLHDGRASTLEQAISLHGGEAEESTKKFNALSLADQQKLLAFLKTLAAP
jgi:CxxC motif-containing protein (DUF1111 family)